MTGFESVNEHRFSSDGTIRGQGSHPRLAGMPGLFLAPAREQVGPKNDCRRNTDSPRANGSKPEVR